MEITPKMTLCQNMDRDIRYYKYRDLYVDFCLFYSNFDYINYSYIRDSFKSVQLTMGRF